MRVGLARNAPAAARVANRCTARFHAPRVVDGIADFAVTADTFVTGPRSLAAIGIVAADSAEVARVADGRVGVLGAGIVARGIARAASPIDAFVEYTIPFGTLPVAVDTGPALSNDWVTDGGRPGFIATGVIGEVTRSAPAGHTLVARTRAVDAVRVACATDTSERVATDGSRGLLGAPVVGSGIASSTTAIDTLVLSSRSI